MFSQNIQCEWCALMCRRPTPFSHSCTRLCASIQCQSVSGTVSGVELDWTWRPWATWSWQPISSWDRVGQTLLNIRLWVRLHADRTSKQYLDQRICFSVIRMPLSWWPAFAGWYQIITVKYDEKQQTKNHRVSIHQTRFILCSQCYCSASCSTSRMPHLAICHYAKQRPPILYSINYNKIQTSFGQTCENISMK